MLLEMPPSVAAKKEELDRICGEHPDYIPIPVLAKFLKANPEGLRFSIEKGQCSWGIAWQKRPGGNKAFKVPTATFWAWYWQQFAPRS